MAGLSGRDTEGDGRQKNQTGDDSPEVQFRIHGLSPDMCREKVPG